MIGTSIAGTGSAAEWPSFRHDRQLTGCSQLKGGLGEAPQVLWSIDLGGQMVDSEEVRIEDVNGDGEAELLRVLPDRLVCQTLAGNKLWEVRGLRDPRVEDIRDYAGDGGRGIFISSTAGLGLAYAMVDGRTGQRTVLLQANNSFGGSSRTGHIIAGVPDLQLCFWWGTDAQEAWGYLWSFENGPAKPTVRVEVHEKGVIFVPLQAFVDIDGDGEVEMVMHSHEQLWAYDLKTMKRKFYTALRPRDELIRNYYSVTGLLPLKPGELPSVLSINSFIPGVQVATQDGTGGSSILWRECVYRVEYQYQSEVKIDAAAPDPFIDLDGDGQIEIMAAVTNEHGDGLTHLVIFGADNGDRLLDEAGVSVLGVDDLDGDGVPEAILKRPDALSIANWTGKEFIDRWRSEDAEPLLVPLEPEGDLRIMKLHGVAGNRTVWRDKPASPLFLMRIDGKVWACRLIRGGSLEKVSVIERHEALGNAWDAPKPDYSWDGSELRTSVNGKEVVGYRMPRHRAYLAAPPVAANIDGRMRVLIRNAAGALLSVSPDGREARTLAENTRPESALKHASRWSGPPIESCYAVADLDGDGRNEVMVAVADSDGCSVLQVLDGDGSVKQTCHPSAPGGDFVLGPTGSLGPGKGQWFVVLVRNPREPAAVVAYDGKTGRELWRRSGYGKYGEEDVSFGLHLPTPVWDYDGDGVDDLICLSANFCGIIDVADNKDLVDPMSGTVLSVVVPGHWTAYAIPSLLFDPQSGKPRLVLSRSYRMAMFVLDIQGAPVWHYGVDRDATNTNLAGLGDLDGDGKIEIVSARRDGLLTAFAWDPLDRKCPTCPEDEPLSEVNHGGEVRWTLQLPPPVSDFASADLDGDGRTELLCGCGDGRLYALKAAKAKCRVLWSVDLGRTVGSPIIADINGDNLPEILVASEDGRLHCLSARRR